jgi:hypothetical protein
MVGQNSKPIDRQWSLFAHWSACTSDKHEYSLGTVYQCLYQSSGIFTIGGLEGLFYLTASEVGSEVFGYPNTAVELFVAADKIWVGHAVSPVPNPVPRQKVAQERLFLSTK